MGGGGSTPKNPNPKWEFHGNVGFFGYFGSFGKRCGMYLYLNIPVNLRTTYFFLFLIGISSGSDS